MQARSLPRAQSPMHHFDACKLCTYTVEKLTGIEPVHVEEGIGDR